MMQGFYSGFAKAVMVWVVAVSLLLVGFAHRPVLNADAIAKVEYMASMGLTIADLCGTPGEDGSVTSAKCPACTVAAGMMLPPVLEGVATIEARMAAAVLIPAQTRVFGRPHNPAAPVRAPPLA